MAASRNRKWAVLEPLSVGADGDPYLDRLRLIQTPLFGIYLHHIHRADLDPDPHDHPWSFMSIVLTGDYTESVWRIKGRRADLDPETRVRSRYSVRVLSRHSAHIITRVSRPLWTLVITGPRKSDWGFWTGDGGYVRWDIYIKSSRNAPGTIGTRGASTGKS